MVLSSDHTRGKSQKPIGTSQLRPRGPDKYRCRKTSGTPGIAWFLYAFRADGENFSFSSFSQLFVDIGRDLSARMMDFASFEMVCDGLLAMVRRDFAPLDGANVAETFVTTRELHVLACPNFSSTSDADSG